MEDCERKCATPDKRRRHLIDKHMYPRNFFFAVTRDGIDGRRSLLEDSSRRRRRRSSAATASESRRRSILAQAGAFQGGGSETQESVASKAPQPRVAQSDGKKEEASTNEDRNAASDTEMDELAGTMAALKFVPSSLRFGRGGRVGFSRR